MSSPVNLNTPASKTRSLNASDSPGSLTPSNRSDSPLIEVTHQVWKEQGKVWLDLVYHNREAMRKFKAKIEKMDHITMNELMRSRTSDTFRCCLRLYIDENHLNETLACILDEHPEFEPPKV